MKKKLIPIFVALAVNTPAQAEESNYIRLGGFIPMNTEGTMQLRENGAGASLDLDEA